MQQKLGKIGLFLVAIIWGSGFVASALALESFQPFQILALRFTLAFGVLLGLNARRLSHLTWRQVRGGGLVGVFLFLGFAFQTVGLQYTTPSKNAFLTAVNVVIVPFLSLIILGDRVPRSALLGALVTLVGIGLLSYSGDLAGINRGDLMTLVCAVFFALQIFYTDYYLEGTPAWALLLAQMGVAAGLSWLSVALTGLSTQAVQPAGIVSVLYLGLVSTLVSYGIQTLSQRYTTSSETAIILSTEAFFGMLASALILQEPISLQMVVGGLVIFLGILVVELDLLGDRGRG